MLDALPIWAVLLLTIAVMTGVYLLGHRAGGRRRARRGAAAPVGLDSVVGSLQVLLAFMLGFVFAMASDRFDQRRELVLAEANAIGTTWLRARTLPEPYRQRIIPLLEAYVDLRLDGLPRRPRTVEEETAQAVAASNQLQERIWRQLTVLAQDQPRSLPVALFMESLNEMIDLQESRVTVALRFRVDPPVWWTLYFVAILTLLTAGYYIGRGGGRRRVITPLLLALASVLVLNIDLDRPAQRLFRVDYGALRDLQQSMAATREAPPAQGTKVQ